MREKFDKDSSISEIQYHLAMTISDCNFSNKNSSYQLEAAAQKLIENTVEYQEKEREKLKQKLEEKAKENKKSAEIASAKRKEKERLEQAKKEKEETIEKYNYLRVKDELYWLENTTTSIVPTEMCVTRFIQRDLDFNKRICVYKAHRDWIPTSMYNAINPSTGLVLPYAEIVTNLEFDELVQTNILECETFGEVKEYIYLPINLFTHFSRIANVEKLEEIEKEVKNLKKEQEKLFKHRDIVKRQELEHQRNELYQEKENQKTVKKNRTR